jgi:dienelactone hydrolase
MPESSEFFTATMARLYADQGYLRKAAEIYRHLVAQHPERHDLNLALVDIENEIAQKQAPTRKDAELLLRQWIDLLKQKKQRERKQ